MWWLAASGYPVSTSPVRRSRSYSYSENSLTVSGQRLGSMTMAAKDWSHFIR